MGIIILGILFLIPLILIGIIILFAIKKSTESFSKKVHTIYCYLILLALLVGIIISLIYIITSLAEVVLPNVESANINEYYRQLITSIGGIIILVPLSFYFKKLLKE